jgi:hypothetical protein
MVPISDCPTLQDYIIRNQVDGILWKANLLLGNVDNPLQLNDRVNDIARTIALFPEAQQVVKDHYIKTISKEHKINPRTLEKLVADHTVIETKKKDIIRTVRKNSVAKLNGEAKTFPFFYEVTVTKPRTNTKVFKGIKVDTLKFVQLLGSFGFTRYAGDAEASKDGYTFVRLQENLINEVTREEIIDYIENFINKEYDFEAAGCEFVDADLLINTFYNNIKKYFSKDLFARVRNASPIIINRDTETECFLYYKNGFVRITKDGYDLLPFDKMEGSVWQKQMLNRNFEKVDLELKGTNEGIDWENSFTTERPLGDYADFVWRISGQKQQRFLSLCSIIGYLMHDYYQYKLKCIFLTDSTVSENSEGRTGKTLAMQMLGSARSYCEINGKQFNPEDERKYQMADRSTQILHINDVNHKGRYKFDFEILFNDITEGYYVRKMFMAPFHQLSKMVVSSNKSINIQGASMRDRIVEFEMSAFFGEHRSPAQYYGKWMGKGWSETDWSKFDNFLCFCVQCFFTHGLIHPETINLEARKLLDGTCREFVEFMNDIRDHLKEKNIPWQGYVSDNNSLELVSDIRTYEFDKNKLFNQFITIYPDWKSNHLTQKRFTMWLRMYAQLSLGIKEPTERRSNGLFYIKFTEPKKES